MNEHDVIQPDDAAVWRQWRDQTGRASDAAQAADDCPSALDLAAFIDGRCDAATRAQIESHLCACALCRAAEADVMAVQQASIDSTSFVRPLALEWAHKLVPASLPEVIVIHHRLSFSSALRVVTGWGVAAAAALAIGLAGYQLGHAAGPSVQLSDDAVATAMSFGLLDDSSNDGDVLILLSSSNAGAQQ